MTHYCIANPCWICYPEFAPKFCQGFYSYEESNLDKIKAQRNNIDSELETFIVDFIIAAIESRPPLAGLK